jgi:RsiW-degrading membrane proteinase PrsW (M82 family)
VLQQTIRFFTSAFYFPGLSWALIATATAIGFIFGAIWLAPYGLTVFKKRWAWAVAAGGALLTWAAIAFIQVPLQSLTGQALLSFWDQATLMRWLLLAGIPQILLSGLVQEAAKLIPVIIYWMRNNKSLAAGSGLVAGAVSGAGFGVFEAIWVHNTIFASGWTLGTIQTSGLTALLGFWERFFTVGFHIAVSALAGYGLAKRRAWQFYLATALLHGLANYSVVLLQSGLLTAVQVEMLIAAISVMVYVAALLLHRRERRGSSFAPGPPVDDADRG